MKGGHGKQNRAAIYVRIANPDPDKQLKLAAVERFRCRQLIEANELVLRQEYLDLGETGSSLNGPALRRLLDDLPRRQFQWLVVTEASQLVRSAREWGRLHQLLRPYDITVVFVVDEPWRRRNADPWRLEGAA